MNNSFNQSGTGSHTSASGDITIVGNFNFTVGHNASNNQFREKITKKLETNSHPPPFSFNNIGPSTSTNPSTNNPPGQHPSEQPKTGVTRVKKYNRGRRITHPYISQGTSRQRYGDPLSESVPDHHALPKNIEGQQIMNNVGNRVTNVYHFHAGSNVTIYNSGHDKLTLCLVNQDLLSSSK